MTGMPLACVKSIQQSNKKAISALSLSLKKAIGVLSLYLLQF